MYPEADTLSLMRDLISCHTTNDMLSLANIFLQEVVCLDVLQLTIVPDPGLRFPSTVWGESCSRLGLN
jgi:hypothetical protein